MFSIIIQILVFLSAVANDFKPGLANLSVVFRPSIGAASNSNPSSISATIASAITSTTTASTSAATLTVSAMNSIIVEVLPREEVIEPSIPLAPATRFIDWHCLAFALILFIVSAISLIAACLFLLRICRHHGPRLFRQCSTVIRHCIDLVVYDYRYDALQERYGQESLRNVDLARQLSTFVDKARVDNNKLSTQVLLARQQAQKLTAQMVQLSSAKDEVDDELEKEKFSSMKLFMQLEDAKTIVSSSITTTGTSEELHQQLSTVQQQKEMAEDVLKAVKKEVSELRPMVISLRGQLEDQQRESANAIAAQKAADESSQRLSEEKEVLKDKLAALDSDQIKAAEELASAHDHDVQVLKDQVVQLTQQLQEKDNKVEASMREKASQVRNLTGELTTARSDATLIIERRRDEAHRALSLQNGLAAANANILALQKDLNEARDAQVVSADTQRLAELTAQTTALHGHLADAQRQFSDEEALRVRTQKELADVRKQLADAQVSLADSQTSLANAQVSHAAAVDLAVVRHNHILAKKEQSHQAVVEGMRQEANLFRDQCAADQGAAEELKEQQLLVSELRAQAETFEARLASANASVSSMQYKLLEAQSIRTAFQEDFEKAKKAGQAAQKQVTKFQQWSVKLQNRIIELEGRLSQANIEDLEYRASMLPKVEGRLTGLVERYRKAKSDARSKNEAYEAQIATLEAQIVDHEEHIKQLQETNDDIFGGG